MERPGEQPAGAALCKLWSSGSVPIDRPGCTGMFGVIQRIARLRFLRRPRLASVADPAGSHPVAGARVWLDNAKGLSFAELPGLLHEGRGVPHPACSGCLAPHPG